MAVKKYFLPILVDKKETKTKKCEMLNINHLSFIPQQLMADNFQKLKKKII